VSQSPYGAKPRATGRGGRRRHARLLRGVAIPLRG